MKANRKRAGYTLLEMAIVLALTPLLVGAMSRLFGSSDGLVQKSRAELRAHEELRRNLEALANVVRGGDIDSIEGFDATGWATAPAFHRVVGADATGRLTDGEERLAWVATPGTVDEVAHPGVVLHIRSGTSTIVARNVPQGGFRVRLAGGTLLIRLTTFYVTSSRELAHVVGETAVALRN